MKLNLYPAFEALSLPHEICYNTEKDNNGIYQLLDFSDHRSSASRGNCRFTRGLMNGYILHTHPYGSKAYPSSEDILQSINSRHTKISFIVTTIGVWELIYKGDKSIDNKNSESIMNRINDMISEPLYDAGLLRGLNRSKPQTITKKQLFNKIKRYTVRVSKLLEKKGIEGFKINFTHIHDIPDNRLYTVNSSSIKSLKKKSKKKKKKTKRRKTKH